MGKVEIRKPTLGQLKPNIKLEMLKTMPKPMPLMPRMVPNPKVPLTKKPIIKAKKK